MISIEINRYTIKLLEDCIELHNNDKNNYNIHYYQDMINKLATEYRRLNKK